MAHTESLSNKRVYAIISIFKVQSIEWLIRTVNPKAPPTKPKPHAKLFPQYPIPHPVAFMRAVRAQLVSGKKMFKKSKTLLFLVDDF